MTNQYVLISQGYSSLAVALALPASGYLVACERDAQSLQVARSFYERASVSHKVDVKHGMAAVILESMISNGEACSYDFAFVDAEKRMNQDYFELLLQLVRSSQQWEQILLWPLSRMVTLFVRNNECKIIIGLLAGEGWGCHCNRQCPLAWKSC
uniref:Uncharacterized protein MANES_01G237200 n=1 Tax=Rhizophora mucronata TaxID=61149 RepID=A0A2P2KEK5_RHIMU